MRTSNYLSTACAVTLALCPSMLHAQQVTPDTAEDGEAATSGSGGISDIIVTANRREQRLQDVPVAVTAISGEDLAAAQLNSVNALQRVTPNLRIMGAGGDPTNASIGMRGQINIDPSVTIDPAVGIYLNGIYLGRSTGGNLDMIDVQRVEVLRGPQGTLFGRNTIGGAINIIPNTPTDVFEGALSASYGNFDSWYLRGIVNVPITERIQIRAVVNHSETDGFARSSFNGRPLGRERKDFVRVSLNADLSDSVSLLISGDNWDYRTSGAWTTLIGIIPDNASLVRLFGSPAGVLAALGPFVGAYDRTPASQTTRPINAYNRGVSGVMTAELGDATFKSLTAYRAVKRIGLDDDSDGTPFVLVNLHGYLSEQEQFSQEFQVYGKAFDSRLDWIAGIYYFRETGTTATGTDVFNSIATTGSYSITQADAKSSSAAIFAQATFSLTDTLRLTGGLRYTKDVRKVLSTNRAVSATNDVANFLLDPAIRCATPGALPTCAFQPPVAKFSYWPFTINLDWKPTNDLLLYGKWSRGFRAGGFNTRPTALGEVPAFGPESLDSYEMGLKADLFDRHLRFNAAAFISKYDDIVVIGSGSITNPTTGLPIASAVAVNAGKATIKGLETELTGVWGGFKLSAMLSLLDAGYDKLDPSVAATVIKESTFRAAPKVQYSLGADYLIRQESADVTFHLDWSYIGKTYFSAVPPTSSLNQQAGYGVLNGMIGAAIHSLPVDVNFWVRNITDKKYVKYTIDTTALGYVSAYPGDPRTYGVTTTFKF